MFTGLIEEVGEVVSTTPVGDGVRLRIAAQGVLTDIAHGASISVSGVCLTVVEWTGEWFEADVMQQTLDMSTLGTKRVGDRVNLERALRADARLGGHIVQGHIDGTGEVLLVRPGDRWRVVRIGLAPAIAPLVVDKGSIAVDGVSLTVSRVDDDWFEVSLIPETLDTTTIGENAVGDRVNLETDILARHVARLVRFQGSEES